jgi:hypothetical protein
VGEALAEGVSAIPAEESDSYQCFSCVSFTASTNHASNVVFNFWSLPTP